MFPYVMCIVALLCAVFNVNTAVTKGSTKFEKITYNVFAVIFLTLAAVIYIRIIGGVKCL